MSSKKVAPQRPNRREFLRSSAVAASALAAGSLSIERSAHAAGSDVYKVGLIGCGGRGSGAAANAMNADPSVRLVAMCDIFASQVEKARRQLAKAKPDQMVVDDAHAFVGFDGFEKVIACDLDLVAIACSSRFHPQYMLAALKAGKNVFVEKPHAIDPAGIHVVEQACKLAKEKKLTVASGLCYRYDPGMRETIQRVHDGAIGEIRAIEIKYLRGPYRMFDRPEGMTEMQYQFFNWYHFAYLSGDDMPQSLVHNIDKAQWAIHEIEPVKCHAMGGRSANLVPTYGDCFDHQAAIFEYPNGLRMYGFCRTQPGCYNETNDILHGTKGRCYMMRKTIEGETNWQYQGPKVSPYDMEHKEIFQAIRAGKRIDDSEHMIRSSMMGIMAQLSAYTGREISWEEINNSQWFFPPKKADFSIDPPVVPKADGLYPVPIPGITKLL